MRAGLELLACLRHDGLAPLSVPGLDRVALHVDLTMLERLEQALSRGGLFRSRPGFPYSSASGTLRGEARLRQARSAWIALFFAVSLLLIAMTGLLALLVLAKMFEPLDGL